MEHAEHECARHFPSMFAPTAADLRPCVAHGCGEVWPCLAHRKAEAVLRLAGVLAASHEAVEA